ncbi:MAG: cytochrome c biogenesis protein CcdA [Endomicrobiia bacterium]|nr:cytochrome c biogenesis protein CcdA [Endomicrobiia bacterium]
MNIIPALSAFFGGFAMFFTPCVLPLIPVYLVYISGLTLSELSVGERAGRLAAFRHSVFFAAGFTTVFFVLGLSATAASAFLFDNKDTVRTIGGALLVGLGFFAAGFWRPRFLMNDKRFMGSVKPAGYAGSFLVGAAFAGGWSPCVGPALVMILSLAASRDTLGQGAALLAFFSAGLAIPFIAAGFFASSLVGFITKIKSRLKYVEVALGILIMLTGLALIFNLI